MKNHFFLFPLLFSILVLLTSCEDDDKVTPDLPSDTYNSAQSYVTESGFQGAMLLRKGDNDIIRQGFGPANAEDGVMNTTDTKFRIGSMSKAFTVMGILQLQRAGLIESLDQSISEFEADFPYGHKITLRQLMGHTSGLPDHVGAFEALYKEENYDLTAEEIVDAYMEVISESGLLFEPGSNFSYSNANYLLLATLIEELSGQSYHEYLRTGAIAGLGMNNTYPSADDFGAIGEATGYRDGTPVNAYLMSIAFGAGDWVSTIEDLELWGKGWMGDLLFDIEKAAVFPAPAQDDMTAIGLGWFAIRIQGELVYFHGGDVDGFTSIIALFPESRGLFIALSNVEGQRNMLDSMMEVFAIQEF